jgi:hypothetical protein
VANFVCTDTDLAILGHRQIGEYLCLVDSERATVQGPFVRPDIVRVAGHFTASSRVNDDKGIDKAIAIVVVGREVDSRI